MVSREAAYDKLVDLIIDAALDPIIWINVLRELAHATGCIAGGLTIENPVAGTGSPIVHFGFDPHYVEQNWAYFLPMNPLFPFANLLQKGAILTNGMVIPESSFKKTEFFNGWAKPQDLCSPLTLVLDRNPTEYMPLTLVRPNGRGDADDDAIALLQRLSPTLSRSLSITLKLNLLEERQAAFEQTIARLSLSVFLVDGSGRVIYANPAAEALLEQGTALRLKAGVIQAVSHHSADLESVISTSVASGGNELTQIAIRRDGLKPLMLAIVPMNAADKCQFGGSRIKCAIIVNETGRQDQCRSRAFSEAYELTSSEMRVLECLLNGNTLAQASTSLAIADSTAKTHLQSIFAKTKVNRQSELIRLAGSMILPLRS